MQRIVCLVSAFVALATVCLAQDTARMDQVVQSFVANGTFTGSVLVARDDKVLFSKAYGRANIEWDLPNTSATKFRIASITKQFTAAAILLLEERGKLKVEDPVKKHLPEAPASWDKMTVFHLLTHTAGFAGLAQATGGGVGQAGNPIDKAVARLMEQPLLSQPGEVFNYTNQGYFVLGHLIQKLSGQSYERFLQANIFTPLGMKSSGLDSRGVIPQRASAYTATPNGLLNAYLVDTVVPNTSAGMYSTTEDLLRWQIGLSGGKVVSAASLKRMMTPVKDDYGFGVYIRTIDGHKAMTHGGGAPPFANLTYYPERRITVVVLGNLNIAPAAELAAFLGALGHGDAVQLASEKKAITLASDVLAKYAGVYQMPGGPSLTIAVEGSQLTAQPSPSKFPMLAESETSFFFRDTNMRVEFVKDSSGAVAEVIIHQGTRQTRVPRAKGASSGR